MPFACALLSNAIFYTKKFIGEVRTSFVLVKLSYIVLLL